jgi:hypothetical protein
LVSSGLGPLLGTVLCQWLRVRYVTADGQGWLEFWGILAAMIAICFGVFAVCYRGQGKRAD